jgi:hypothetical protein
MPAVRTSGITGSQITKETGVIQDVKTWVGLA